MQPEILSGDTTEGMEDNFGDAEEIKKGGLRVVGSDDLQNSLNKGEGEESWSDIISSPAEVDLICRLHRLLGDRWELIAARLPNRRAEDVEHYWKMKERREVGENKLIKPICVKLSPSFRFSMASINLS